MLLSGCGGGQPADGDGAAAVEEYPDTIYARVTEQRLSAFGAVDSVSLARAVLVRCPGGTGEQRAGSIGREGGTIVLPKAGHELIIPAEAVDRTYQFILRDVPAGDHLVVTAVPDGIRFAVPALLVINFQRCTDVPDPSRLLVVRINPKGQPGDDLGGTVADRKISARLGHLSAYGLAVPLEDSP